MNPLVALDLHEGPGTCHLAAQKEFVIALPFAIAQARGGAS